ncbi:glycoside hydrolase family 47 protein [Xylariaceae sp. FL0804]|nr:glycoside hydrolase family 47 protein [Xylariaceae sp. FL0804]
MGALEVMARRRLWFPALIATALTVYFFLAHHHDYQLTSQYDTGVAYDGDYFWRKVPVHYPVPVEQMRKLPTKAPLALPRVQAAFEPEGEEEQQIRLKRQQAVKNAFARCWNSYKSKAWMSDEMGPLSGDARNPSGGWGATLVDAMDTLWIMDMHDEFEEAVQASTLINFERSMLEDVNALETTNRYLAGFLSAYDLSGDQRLLRKAREVGDMLYLTFDTPNRMPITYWNLRRTANGEAWEAPEHSSLAEIGSLCLEFTRLSLITGDPRWYDAAERVRELLEEQQSTTMVPGMWPLTMYPRVGQANTDNTFGFGVLADSAYEYLPKMHALMGGLIPSYQKMYESAVDTAIERIFWRPMVPDSADILIPGTMHVEDEFGHRTFRLEHQAQHLSCFAGGMLALGGKLTGNSEHLATAEKLVDGCVYTNAAMPLGIMPERFNMAACSPTSEDCAWDETLWRVAILEQAGESVMDLALADEIITEKSLPKGFTEIADTHYNLRAEAVESVFVLYRATGRRDLVESAWAMFETMQRNTETKLANSVLIDVMVDHNAPKTDAMASFWMGETLKYFYLLFSEPDLINLDEWVFNTQAHPLRRLR